MTERENLLLALNHETPKWTPYYSHDVAIVSSSLMNEDGPIGGGLDYWGVKWIHDDMGPMVDVNDPPLIDDVTRWRELIRVPDIDAMDWKKQCEEDLAAQKPDRDNKLVILFTKKGFCERLMALLGYEGFLISLYEEPEAVCDLLDTLADFRCKMLDRLIYYFKPDIVICGGDFSSGTNLLMAPDVWRKIIKPYIKREIDVVRSHGLFVDFHSCGKCESVVEEFYEMGAHLWSSAQVMNDINSLLTKLENRMCIAGGWDSQGSAGMKEADEETVRAEVRKSLEKYGSHKNYLFDGLALSPNNSPASVWILDEYKRIVRPDS